MINHVDFSHLIYLFIEAPERVIIKMWVGNVTNQNKIIKLPKKCKKKKRRFQGKRVRLQSKISGRTIDSIRYDLHGNSQRNFKTVETQLTKH